MGRERLEGSLRFSRRDVLRVALGAATAVGISQIFSSKSYEVKREFTVPKITSLPTIDHDVVLVTAPPAKLTLAAQENLVEVKPTPTVSKPLIIEEKEKPRVSFKENSPEYNLLKPEAFAPYAGFGEGDNSGLWGFFPESYKQSPAGLIGLWNRAIEAKLTQEPKSAMTLVADLATEFQKLSFDYLPIPEGTVVLDLQEKKERTMLLPTNVIIIGKIDQKNNFLALYQEPVNDCYYFGQVQFLKSTKLTSEKNSVDKTFIEQLERLAEVGTEEERKRLYSVKKGDSLSSIAAHFGLPSWHCVYGKNIEILDADPNDIMPAQKLFIPDKYTEKEWINKLTPGQSKLTLGKEFFVSERGRYFPETGHYINGPFLEFYQKYGEEVLGQPITEVTPDGRTQQFQKMVLDFDKVDEYAYVPGRPKTDGINPRILVRPLGLAYGPPGILEIDKYQLRSDFEQFYNKHGGLEVLGFPISEAVKKDDNKWQQWLTNCLLECTLDNGAVSKVEIANVQEDWNNKMLGSVMNYFEQYKKLPEEITVDMALQRIKETGANKNLELDCRTVALLVYWQNGKRILTVDKKEKRDDLIFDKLAPGQEKNFANGRAILAWHEVRYDMNPVIEKVLPKMRKGCLLINEIIQEELPVNLFKGDQYPLLPIDLHNIFVFGGTPPDSKPSMTLGGGEGYEDFPLVWGRFDLYRGLNPTDEIDVLRGLMSGFHELIHSRIQPQSKLLRSPWDEEKEEKVKKEKGEDAVALENQESFLAHMSMCSLTAPAQELYGFEPGIDPRIIQIYWVLRKGKVENPYGEIIRAAATFNAKRLVDLYQEHRRKGDPLLTTTLAILSVPSDIANYFAAGDFDRARAEFRKEYSNFLREVEEN